MVVEFTSPKEDRLAQAGWISRVAVLGAGTMGHGIAQLSSMAGCDVMVRDIEERFLDKGLERIRWSLEKLVAKDKIAKDQAAQALSRIKTTVDLKEAVSGADLVIEAVPEILETKRKTFAEINKYAPPQAILASNTSSMPIDEMANSTDRPEKVIGMHFFNPPQLMPLVEIVMGSKTTDSVLKVVEQFSRRLGKETIVCRKYVPGFIVNNILRALSDAAILMYTTKEASPEEIDSALRHKAGLPMGIFELADYSGIDVLYNSRRFSPSPDHGEDVSSVLKKLVDEGRLGAKVGRGFYEWKNGQRPRISSEAGKGVDIIPIIANGLNAALELIRGNVATRDDIEKGVRLGLGYPKGIFEMSDEIGFDRILDSLEKFNKLHIFSKFVPSPLLIEFANKGKRKSLRSCAL